MAMKRNLALTIFLALITGAITFIPGPGCIARNRSPSSPLSTPFSSTARQSLLIPGVAKRIVRAQAREDSNFQEYEARSQSQEDDEGVKVARLKSQLQDAVQDEDFLEAARLKEQLSKIQRKSVKRMFDALDNAAESTRLSSDLMAPQTKSRTQLANAPKSFVLSEADRRREDESPDAIFYEKPRFVMHYDVGYAVKLQGLYKERLLEGGRILDLGASCATMLPDNLDPSEVVGLGMNMNEMRENEALTSRVTHDLNESPVLPFRDSVFDAVLMSSVFSYLSQPEQVLAEVRRVLRPAGVLIITFTDRMWNEKATEAWKTKGSLGRCVLVQECVRAAGGLTEPELVVDSPLLLPVGQLVPALRDACGGDPFLAVVAYKGTPPPGWAMIVSGPGMVKLPLVNATVRALNITPFAAMYLLYILFSHTFLPH